MRTVDDRLTLLRVQRTAATLLRWYTASIAHVWVCNVRRYERLRLSGYWCKDTFLLEALAVDASAVVGGLEAGAANLAHVSQWVLTVYLQLAGGAHLAPTAITACYRRALPRCWLIETHVLRWTTAIRILSVSWIHVVRRVAVEVLMLLLRGR